MRLPAGIRGALGAYRARMLTHSLIDSAYTRLATDVARLRTALERIAWTPRMRTVNQAPDQLGDQLGDAINRAPIDPAVERLVRDSFISVLALAQLLGGAHSPDPQTLAALDGARRSIDRLLDSLEPYVTHHDREARRVLLRGEPLEAALARVYYN